MCTTYLELVYTYNKLSGQVIYLIFRSNLEENQLNLKSLHPCCQHWYTSWVGTRCFFDYWLVMAPAGLACRLWFLLIFYEEQFYPDQQKTLSIIYANWFISQSNVGLIEIKIRMIKGSNQQYSKLNSLWFGFKRDFIANHIQYNKYWIIYL